MGGLTHGCSGLLTGERGDVIDVAERGEDLVDGTGVDNVDGIGDGVTPDGVARRVESFPVTCDQHDVSTGGPCRDRRRQPHPRATTGDDHDSATELLDHGRHLPTANSRVC